MYKMDELEIFQEATISVEFIRKGTDPNWPIPYCLVCFLLSKIV